LVYGPPVPLHIVHVVVLPDVAKKYPGLHDVATVADEHVNVLELAHAVHAEEPDEEVNVKNPFVKHEDGHA